ncbi:MAG: segregation/condensation protein A [Candidatus Pelethousia sp.]|nr:segregation/condensation protein A [Candidatus Pelethousia sp.]
MAAYEVHLKQFEGPLDLLLHLIEQAEVDIKDIFISEITAQYLEYMAHLDGMDMDMASEFLTMATTLVYIKSRSLLPRPPKEEGEEEDPAEVLIRQLREYKAMKEASIHLENLLHEARGAFTKLPEEFLLPPKEVIWEESSPAGLLTAFLELLSRREDERAHAISSHEVQADIYTVRTQLVKIRSLLQGRERIDFRDLFASGTSKLEMIVTFMALLDMLTRGEVRLKQSGPYEPIAILPGDILLDDENFEYMDEQ